MKRTGELLLFNTTVTQGAINTLAQTFFPTGLSSGGNSGLLVTGIQLERTSSPAAGSRTQVAVSRATKAAVPNIDDDDLIVKLNRQLVLVGTSGLVELDYAPFLALPPSQIVIVEANVYVQLNTVGETTVQTFKALVYAELVELTDKEKSTILATRLNNLLN
jgi:hypothetical protein